MKRLSKTEILQWNMDFMKDKEGKINYYDTEDEACLVCGLYKFENAWVMKLIYNHIEDNN